MLGSSFCATAAMLPLSAGSGALGARCRRRRARCWCGRAPGWRRSTSRRRRRRGRRRRGRRPARPRRPAGQATGTSAGRCGAGHGRTAARGGRRRSRRTAWGRGRRTAPGLLRRASTGPAAGGRLRRPGPAGTSAWPGSTAAGTGRCSAAACSDRRTGSAGPLGRAGSGVGSDPGVCWSFTGSILAHFDSGAAVRASARARWSSLASSGPGHRVPRGRRRVGSVRRDSEVGRAALDRRCLGGARSARGRRATAAPTEPAPTTATRPCARRGRALRLDLGLRPAGVAVDSQQQPTRWSGGAGCAPVRARPARRVLTQPSRSTRRGTGARVHVLPGALGLGRRAGRRRRALTLDPRCPITEAAPGGLGARRLGAGVAGAARGRGAVGERLAQHGAAAVDAGADGAELDVEDLGDLLVGQPLDVAEHDGGAEVRRQLGQRGLDVVVEGAVGVRASSGAAAALRSRAARRRRARRSGSAACGGPGRGRGSW